MRRLLAITLLIQLAFFASLIRGRRAADERPTPVAAAPAVSAVPATPQLVRVPEPR